MKVFIIPSWYPSKTDPLYGIFNKEQSELLATNRPNWSIGVSTWGQGDERFMLRALDFRSLPRILKMYPSDRKSIDNTTTYFSPAFTWTRKIRRGNINGIIEANKQNLNRFTKDYGKPDIISVHAAYPGAIVAQTLSKTYNIPYVVTAHMSPFPFKEFLKGGEIKSLIKDPLLHASVLIATSRSLENRMRSLGLSHTIVIPNAVDTDYFSRSASDNSGKKVILSIGRMEDQKGVDMLLEAFAKLPDRDHAELRIGGEGTKKSTYKSLAKKLGIADKVKWLGSLSRSQVLQEMQSCSFFALASRHETFGIVLVEAMACGKPVLATRCGGPEDIISENVGLLCEPDVTSIHNGLVEMLKTCHEYDAEKIRGEAINRYSPPIWTSQIEKLFREVIEK